MYINCLSHCSNSNISLFFRHCRFQFFDDNSMTIWMQLMIFIHKIKKVIPSFLKENHFSKGHVNYNWYILRFLGWKMSIKTWIFFEMIKFLILFLITLECSECVWLSPPSVCISCLKTNIYLKFFLNFTKNLVLTIDWQLIDWYYLTFW